jgi:hypothetical protein
MHLLMNSPVLLHCLLAYVWLQSILHYIISIHYSIHTNDLSKMTILCVPNRKGEAAALSIQQKQPHQGIHLQYHQ